MRCRRIAVGGVRGSAGGPLHVEGKGGLLEHEVLILEPAQQVSEVLVLLHLARALLFQSSNLVFELDYDKCGGRDGREEELMLSQRRPDEARPMSGFESGRQQRTRTSLTCFSFRSRNAR